MNPSRRCRKYHMSLSATTGSYFLITITNFPYLLAHVPLYRVSSPPVSKNGLGGLRSRSILLL